MSAPGTNADGETRVETETDGVTKRRTAPLLARRKQNLSRDEHVSEYTLINGNGEKIHRVEYDDDEEGTKTVDANLTKLLSATPSTTSNIEVLRIEAQQAVEATGDDLRDMNPHIPSNDDVLEAAAEVIESAGLTPAWEVVDGPAEVSDE